MACPRKLEVNRKTQVALPLDLPSRNSPRPSPQTCHRSREPVVLGVGFLCLDFNDTFSRASMSAPQTAPVGAVWPRGVRRWRRL